MDWEIRLRRKIALEIVVNDDYVDRTIDAILNVARTGSEGNIGDGKVFVLPLDESIRISDQIHGPEAV